MKGFADRVTSVKEYYFSKKLREVGRLVAEGKPILNLGIGSPDLSPPEEVILALKGTADNSQSHGYQNYQGIPELRASMAQYYQQSFGVTLDPSSEILPLMGSKEGILHISMAFLNSADEVLIPNPGYPTYTSVTELLGAKPIFYELDLEKKGRPNFEALEQLNLEKVKLMWVNYPHMPTGATGSKSIFEELIAFGKKHNILIVHDNPYAHILTDEAKSIFQFEGAKEIALELNSLSKSFNIPGWRVGMITGKADYIQGILKVKSNTDSGMFLGIQKGAIAALKLGERWFEDLNHSYQGRRKLVWLLADELGLSYSKETAGLFVWCKVPEGKSPEELVDQLLYEQNIFITPGAVFGAAGKNHVRISLCLPEFKILEAINRIKTSKKS